VEPYISPFLHTHRVRCVCVTKYGQGRVGVVWQKRYIIMTIRRHWTDHGVYSYTVAKFVGRSLRFATPFIVSNLQLTGAQRKSVLAPISAAVRHNIEHYMLYDYNICTVCTYKIYIIMRKHKICIIYAHRKYVFITLSFIILRWRPCIFYDACPYIWIVFLEDWMIIRSNTEPIRIYYYFLYFSIWFPLLFRTCIIMQVFAFKWKARRSTHYAHNTCIQVLAKYSFYVSIKIGNRGCKI